MGLSHSEDVAVPCNRATTAFREQALCTNLGSRVYRIGSLCVMFVLFCLFLFFLLFHSIFFRIVLPYYILQSFIFDVVAII